MELTIEVHTIQLAIAITRQSNLILVYLGKRILLRSMAIQFGIALVMLFGSTGTKMAHSIIPTNLSPTNRNLVGGIGRKHILVVLPYLRMRDLVRQGCELHILDITTMHKL